MIANGLAADVAGVAGVLLRLPLIAAVAGWLVAGREPKVIARQPLN